VRTHAHLVFVDETGFLLQPLVQRTWAPRGETPTLRHRFRHHQRVSCIGGLSLSPQRARLAWYLRFHRDQSIRQEEVMQFLRHLLQHLRGRVVVLWDHSPTHRSRLLQRWLRRCCRLHLEYFPGYAPELNPIEYGWAYLKGPSLANCCPPDADSLHERVVAAAEDVAQKQALLRGFVKASKLPIKLRH
jgi:transposase